MASYQPVAFQSPGFDYGADLSQIERRRALAAALAQQGMTPVDTPQTQPGQFATPISPWQGAAKIGQVLAAHMQQKKADERQRELSATAQGNLQSTLLNAQKAASGTPGTSLSEDASGNVTPAQPAVPGDMMKAASLYMQHPMTSQLGMGMAQQEMQSQQRARLMAQYMKPDEAPVQNAAAGGSAPAYGSPGFQPGNSQSQPQPAGNPMAGLPPKIVSMLTSGDPEIIGVGKILAENYKMQNVRPGGTVFQPGVGPVFTAPQNGMQTTWGAQGPQTAAVPGAQETAARGAGMTAAATEAGKAPYQLSTVNTPGSPSLMTHQQQIEAATGRPMPAPWLTPQPSQQSGAPMRPYGLRMQDQSQSAANTEAGQQFIQEMRQNYSKLRDVPATIDNMNRAKVLASGQAGQFMGPLGESKLALTKFFRSNVPGQGNLNLEGVRSAEELQSTLFNQVMDNLKKMDASPSQYQQQVMQEAFGTLRTDPQSVPKILDVFEDILRNKVAIHNETVGGAEKRGTTFPYDVRVKLPDRIRSFTSEVDAAKAGLKKGDRVIINGVSGTWQ